MGVRQGGVYLEQTLSQTLREKVLCGPIIEDPTNSLFCQSKSSFNGAQPRANYDSNCCDEDRYTAP